jgi:hypothetical protein
MVLTRFGDDANVLGEFTLGVHHLEMMVGPLSSVYEGYRKVAEQFMNHPVAAIRKWAAEGIAMCREMEAHAEKEEERRGW